MNALLGLNVFWNKQMGVGDLTVSSHLFLVQIDSTEI